MCQLFSFIPVLVVVVVGVAVAVAVAVDDGAILEEQSSACPSASIPISLLRPFGLFLLCHVESV